MPAEKKSAGKIWIGRMKLKPRKADTVDSKLSLAEKSATKEEGNAVGSTGDSVADPAHVLWPAGSERKSGDLKLRSTERAKKNTAVPK